MRYKTLGASTRREVIRRVRDVDINTAESG